ncbi:MAG: sensor histidine kinase [Sterolibacteriaceae bacterium MAG5]|nr:sensor histidine kinase [Candidatus Nitricoxidireducens bremensis]
MSIFSEKARLIAWLGAILAIGFLSTTIGGYIVSRDSIRHGISAQALPLTADNIYSEIQKDLLRPVFISSLMAHDTFVRDWVLGGERNPDSIVRYLAEVKLKYDTVSSFLVSANSGKYYYADGILKTVQPGNPADKWFYRVRDMAEAYETNIDPDMANRNTMTIFINYRVLDYEGRFIAATGVGLTLDTVNKLIDRYQEQFRRRIFFVDPQGTIVLAGKSMSEIRGSIRNMEGIGTIAERILETGSTHTHLEYTHNDAQVMVNSRFIPELGWFLIVEQEDLEETAPVRRIFFINLAIAAVAGLLVFGILLPAINRYQRRIEAMAREALDNAGRELERAADQQQFVAMVSHEFRTPLAIIDASLQTLRQLEADTPPDVTARHRKIHRASARLQELIGNYLTGDRLRHSEVAVRMEPLALFDLVAATGRRSEWPQLHLETAEETATVQGDPELLRIAFSNLVSNAMKYSPEDSPIRIACRVRDGWAEVEIRDQGIGIAADEIPKIFDKYYRAPGNKASGAGLGLYLVKQIVELHGGSVAAESTPGAGTTMRVRLPLAPAA